MKPLAFDLKNELKLAKLLEKDAVFSCKLLPLMDTSSISCLLCSSLPNSEKPTTKKSTLTTGSSQNKSKLRNFVRAW